MEKKTLKKKLPKIAKIVQIRDIKMRETLWYWAKRKNIYVAVLHTDRKHYVVLSSEMEKDYFNMSGLRPTVLKTPYLIEKKHANLIGTVKI